jgi:LPXTG-motif cell wall-anchored protein
VQTAVQWSLTLGMPLLFAVFGLVRWRRRESQRDQAKL